MLPDMTAYSGIFPVVPTTFSPDGELDLASQTRAIDYLIDTGAHGLCILANYSEQFSLSDAEREQLTALMLEHVAGRVPVVVTTSHYSSRIVAERSRRAQDLGASMVMIMAPVPRRHPASRAGRHQAGLCHGGRAHRYPHPGPGRAHGGHAAFAGIHGGTGV